MKIVVDKRAAFGARIGSMEYSLMIIAVTRKGRRISMAIKIIKPGKKPDTIKRFTCSHCGCVFEADRDDYGLVGDAYRNQWAYMTCPTCGHKVYRLRDE